MHLKRLDLLGFKSFPDKIKLEFNLGITAVVGPNGSGKSNIADAVRWVLGEQSAKNLRGGKMEDVIFSGTQNRKPLGLAEVSITIDNYDHKLAIEFSEVTVTRRVFRSGESAYLINGSLCRLRDINELFMDTGVGKEGYSIIGQGRVDEILSTKSEERRLLFDEAAGIVKFKSRRNEAENKLSREQQNLIRVDDILSELEAQVQPLYSQSEKAKKYLNIVQRLKVVSINIFIQEIEKYELDFNKFNLAAASIENDIKFQKNKIELTRNMIKQTKDSIIDVESQLRKLMEFMSGLRASLVQYEADVKLAEEQIQHIQYDIKRLQSNIEKNNTIISNTKNEIDILQSKKNAQNIYVKTITNNLEKLQNDFDSLNLLLSENEAQSQSYKLDLIEKIKLTADYKSNIERNSSLIDHLNSRIAQLLNEKSVNDTYLNDKNIHIKVRSIEKEALLKRQQELLKDINLIKQQQTDIEILLNEYNASSSAILRKINESESRLKVLSDMEREHEGFYKSVKAILKLSERNELEGIAGAVGELLNVPADCETAIEIALGSNLQNIVANTEDDAKIAIDYLKRSKLGRATFLPISSIKAKGFSLSEKNNIIKNVGVVGIAIDLVSFDNIYYNVISSLLGKVVIVDNIQNAINIARKFKYSFRIVTVDGEVLNTSGALTGGSLNNKTTNLFFRSREISKLKADLEVFSKESLELEQKTKDEKERFDICIQNIYEKDSYSQEIKMSIAAIEQDINQTSYYISELSKKNNDIENEVSQLNKQLSESLEAVEENNNSLLKLNEQIEEIQNVLLSFQDSLTTDKTSKELLLNDITKHKVDISSKEQELKSLNDNISRIEKEIATLGTDINNFHMEIEEKEKSRFDKVEIIDDIKNSIAENKQLQIEKQEVIFVKEQEKDELNKILNKNEELLQESTEHMSVLNNELFKIRSRIERLQSDRQQIYDTMWDDYEVTYQSAKQYEKLDISLAELRKEERLLKSSIKELGGVNIAAIEQYKNLKSRFDFLQNQRNDIVDAESKLKKIITDLTSLMERQFKEQFEVIAKNFSTVFSEMFGGGKATVKLSDENSVLTSSIEIIAQPPGKALQSMSLLSGGERALTAIALLFAIQKMKPSPFCILDEIEAALDDANVKRYAEYLKKLVTDTQFIVVTHRKGTMEAANVLYGVTMQEQGVSKIVSVKFEDAMPSTS